MAAKFLDKDVPRYDLFLLVEPGRISYLVTQNQFQALCLGDAPGEVDDKDFGATILQMVRDVTAEADIVLPWRTVYLCWSSMDAAVVPSRLFHPDHASQYLNRLTHLHQEAEILTDVWKQPAAHLVYSIWSDLMHGIRQIYPDVEMHHHNTLLVQAWLRNCNSNSGDQVFMHVLTKRIVVAYFTGSNLVFINQFHVEHAIDCLYFVMLVYDQFRLQVREVPLSVSGRISTASAAYEELVKFIGHVQEIKYTSKVDISALPEVPNAATYYDLLSFPQLIF